mgnify:CR=1 FL=1
MPDTRPTTRLGSITFEPFDHPPLETDSAARTVEHKPLGESTVVQHLGAEAKTFTMRGECDESTASEIDDLVEGEELSLRHTKHSGTVLVVSASTDSDGAFLDVESRDLRYTYRIEMREVTN